MLIICIIINLINHELQEFLFNLTVSAEPFTSWLSINIYTFKMKPHATAAVVIFILSFFFQHQVHCIRNTFPY